MKKIRGIVVVSLFLGILMAVGVSAATNYLKILSPLLDLLKAVMQDLPKNPQYAPVYFKFVIWMIAYGILSMSVRNIPMWKDDPTVQKNAKMVILFMSMAGVIFMPNKTVQGLFYTFSVFILAGFIFFIYQNAKQWGADTGNGAIAPIAFIALGILTLLASGLIFDAAPYSTWDIGIGTLTDVMNLLGIILIIIGMVLAFTQGKKGEQKKEADKAVKEGEKTASEEQKNHEPANEEEFQKELIDLNGALEKYRVNLRTYGEIVNSLPAQGSLDQKRTEIVSAADAVSQAALDVNELLVSIQKSSKMFEHLPQNGERLKTQFNENSKQYLQSYNNFVKHFSTLSQRF
jgi:hypothetical protein